ncbi:hypothetical protein [Streptomyces albospinus]|nr:hypothetical protein [Streptomyces albospinus]
MAELVRVREIDDDAGQRLLRIVRRGTGSADHAGPKEQGSMIRRYII